MSQVWLGVAEIETVTNMTHPQWKISRMSHDRLQALSTPEALLGQLHSIHLELCHSHTIMLFAKKFGTVCSEAIVEMETRRKELGFTPLSNRHASGLKDAFTNTLVRCDSMSDRLLELSNRINGQINVVRASIAHQKSYLHRLHQTVVQSHRPEGQQSEPRYCQDASTR